MPHSTTKRKRTKRPDVRPNGKRRLKAQQAQAERDRVARVAARERRGKLLEVPRHEALPPAPAPAGGDGAAPDRARARKAARASPAAVRVRALHKLLRQIVALEERQTAGATLDGAQRAKVGRFEAVAAELEALQGDPDASDDGDGDGEGEGEERSSRNSDHDDDGNGD